MRRHRCVLYFKVAFFGVKVWIEERVFWNRFVRERKITDSDLCFLEHARYKRQFDTSSASQIDLNITVPYIFSARLYPYGPVHGDRIAQLDPQPFYLQAPLFFLDRSYDVIYVILLFKVWSIILYATKLFLGSSRWVDNNDAGIQWISVQTTVEFSIDGRLLDENSWR